MTRTPETIPAALDTALSGVSRDPALYAKVISAAKEDTPPVKRRLTMSMAFVLILILLAGSAAIAAAYRGVRYFLVERMQSSITLNEEYLLSNVSHTHSDPYISISVVDAYWDGVDLSIACHISPVDSAHAIRIDCSYPEHEHYRLMEDADILLDYGIGQANPITITDNASGASTRAYRCSSNWIYEEDESLTLLLSLPLNSMTNPSTVSIPFSAVLTANDETSSSMLQCSLPALTDPIAAHEHDWQPANCTSPMICTICGRSEGGLGEHDYQPSEDFPELSVCTHCRHIRKWRSHGIPSSVTLQPGDQNDYVLLLRLRLLELGLIRGASDLYDASTFQAVKAFQKSAGLPLSGVCDAATIEKLFP